LDETQINKNIKKNSESAVKYSVRFLAKATTLITGCLLSPQKIN